MPRSVLVKDIIDGATNKGAQGYDLAIHAMEYAFQHVTFTGILTFKQVQELKENSCRIMNFRT